MPESCKHELQDGGVIFKNEKPSWETPPENQESNKSEGKKEVTALKTGRRDDAMLALDETREF